MMNESYEESDAGLGSVSKQHYMHLSSSEKGELIFKEIRNSYTFWQIKKQLKDELIKPNGKYSKQLGSGTYSSTSHEIQEAIPKLLKDLNLETKIKNKVHEILDRNGYFREVSTVTQTKFKQCTNSQSALPEAFYDSDVEPLESIAASKSQWCDHLKMKLNSFNRKMCKGWIKQRKVTPKPAKKTVQAAVVAEDEDIVPGSDQEREQIQQMQAMPKPEATNYQITASGPTSLCDTASLYDWKTFYEQVLKTCSSNYAGNHNLNWGVIKMNLQTRSLENLRKKFVELNVTMRQVGVDEEKQFVDERILMGERLLNKDYQPFLVQYAKRGVPSALRARVYKKILYADITQKEMDYFSSLSEYNAGWELVLDDLILSDIIEICNDDKYFIFQDIMESCVMLFFRDRQVFDNLCAKPNTPFVAVGPHDKPIGVYPPCGIIPVQHFSSYFAPFCYISDQKEEIYFIFRAFYCKYLCHLQTISSHPQGIISMCKLFEDLLQTYEPEVCYHLNLLGINPLKTVFPWIYYAFVNVLEVEQVYYIYDRVLGFESLEILPIAAAGIFSFRANMIINCQNQDEFDELFVDLSMLKITPILQHFLFSAGVN